METAPSALAGDTKEAGWISGSGKFPGVLNGNLLQYSFLENIMYRRTWRATVYGAIVSQTPLSDQVHIV